MLGYTDSPFRISLSDFDGPIDLLLHLVKSHELPIERVSLAQVTEQYLSVIEGLPDLDLEVASEYLVVAATLLSIKACALLSEKSAFEGELEENMPDPHRELLENLRRAEVFKEGAVTLQDRDLLGVDVFRAKPTLDAVEDPEPQFVSHDAMLLGEAFRKLLEKNGATKALLRIEFDSTSVVERMIKILDNLKAAGTPLRFSKLFEDLSDRLSLIGSFVALLELAKRRAIVIKQEVGLEIEAADSEQAQYGEIFIALSGEELNTIGLESEFDRSYEEQSDEPVEKVSAG